MLSLLVGDHVSLETTAKACGQSRRLRMLSRPLLEVPLVFPPRPRKHGTQSQCSWVYSANKAMKSRWNILVFAASLALGQSALCPLLAEEADNPRPVSYETDIRPLLAHHCWECHGEKKRKAELDLRSKAGMLKGGES